MKQQSTDAIAIDARHGKFKVTNKYGLYQVEYTPYTTRKPYITYDSTKLNSIVNFINRLG